MPITYEHEKIAVHHYCLEGKLELIIR